MKAALLSLFGVLLVLGPCYAADQVALIIAPRPHQDGEVIVRGSLAYDGGRAKRIMSCEWGAHARTVVNPDCFVVPTMQRLEAAERADRDAVLSLFKELVARIDQLELKIEEMRKSDVP